MIECVRGATKVGCEQNSAFKPTESRLSKTDIDCQQDGFLVHPLPTQGALQHSTTRKMENSPLFALCSAAAPCVNTLLGNSCFHFCVTVRLRALCGWGVSDLKGRLAQENLSSNSSFISLVFWTLLTRAGISTFQGIKDSCGTADQSRIHLPESPPSYDRCFSNCDMLRKWISTKKSTYNRDSGSHFERFLFLCCELLHMRSFVWPQMILPVTKT